MKYKICIVIATKDSNYIVKCLESTKIISVPFDLYIVDNDSSDQQYFKTAEQYGTLIKNEPTKPEPPIIEIIVKIVLILVLIGKKYTGDVVLSYTF